MNELVRSMENLEIVGGLALVRGSTSGNSSSPNPIDFNLVGESVWNSVEIQDYSDSGPSPPLNFDRNLFFLIVKLVPANSELIPAILKYFPACHQFFQFYAPEKVPAIDYFSCQNYIYVFKEYFVAGQK